MQRVQAPISFHIQARDSRDKKLTEGGDYVVVRVIPGSTALAAGAKESEAIVKDNEDGSYTATYSVEARGDYQVAFTATAETLEGTAHLRIWTLNNPVKAVQWKQYVSCGPAHRQFALMKTGAQ